MPLPHPPPTSHTYKLSYPAVDHTHTQTHTHTPAGLTLSSIPLVPRKTCKNTSAMRYPAPQQGLAFNNKALLFQKLLQRERTISSGDITRSHQVSEAVWDVPAIAIQKNGKYPKPALTPLL